MFRSRSAPVRQWLVVALWLSIGLAALPFAARVNDELSVSTRLQGSESARVDVDLSRQFKSPFTRIALLRVAGGPSPKAQDGRSLLQQVILALRRSPHVQGTMSYLDREDTLFLGTDDSPIVIVGLNDTEKSNDDPTAGLRAITDALRANLSGTYPALRFGWTGEAAVNADIRRISAGQTRAAELRVLPLTLLVLLIAFRSLIASLLPLICGALSIVVSLGVVAVLNRYWPASIIVVSIISMVGLGLSIDYALLIVSRYRDGLDQGLSHAEATRVAVRRGGHTVILSGSTVAIGFAALLLVKVSEVRSIGVGGLLVTVIAVLVARTLLPALLSTLGPWMTRGRHRPRADGDGIWRVWAAWVTRYPVRVLIVAGVPLLILAWQASQLRMDLPRGRWLPESAPSVRVLHEIDAVSRGNFGQIMHIILVFPPGMTATDEAGWRAESKLARSLARDPRVQHVWAATTLSAVPLGGPEILARLPESVRRSFVSADGGEVLLEVLPRSSLTAADATHFVRAIRAWKLASVAGIDGAHLIVGGVPAFNVDYRSAIGEAMLEVVLSVIVATLIVLSVVFRSVLIPLKAVVLNLLSVGAAYGAVALVFQDGFGAGLFGLAAPMEGGFPIVPVLVFCIVFGLSMDYEVFIVARVADGRRSGKSDDDALIDGIATTGRVVSFAAAIMVLVFGGFVIGDFIVIKILGFALGVAVTLDATVVRLALGPALIRLAGRWNWWPGP